MLVKGAWLGKQHSFKGLYMKMPEVGLLPCHWKQAAKNKAFCLNNNNNDWSNTFWVVFNHKKIDE